MTEDEIHIAGEDEREALLAILTVAFAADPPTRFIWKTPEGFLSAFPRLATAMGGRAFDQGTAFIRDDFAAAALWLPPGIEIDGEALDALLSETVPAETREKMAQITPAFGSFHPHEPHWYLPWLGVDPSRQGRGLGSLMLKHSLRRVDETGLPAYLESSNPKNIPLYERFGFEVLGVIQGGDFPPITPMLRPAMR
ncbi:MAG TPA: GNAT family N-acetyltransferase [Caulobacteraceae bacterium]|nr:GNAT family N-acetyltransferase [Caulobacteraceae bacterium]